MYFAGGAAAVSAIGLGLYIAKQRKQRELKRTKESRNGGSLDAASNDNVAQSSGESGNMRIGSISPIEGKSPRNANVQSSCRHIAVHKRVPIPEDVCEHSTYSNYQDCTVTHMSQFPRRL